MISCGKSQNLGDCHPLLWGDWVSNSVTGYSGSSPEQAITRNLILVAVDADDIEKFELFYLIIKIYSFLLSLKELILNEYQLKLKGW